MTPALGGSAKFPLGIDMKSFALASVAFSLLSGATALAAEDFDFRLLCVHGALVHWEASGAGPVTVTYGFVTQPERFAGARNCEAMVPLDSLLKRSEISPSVFLGEVRAAFEMWEQAANIRFVETSDTANASLLIGAQQSPEGRAFTNVAQRRDKPTQNERWLVCPHPPQRRKDGFVGHLEAYDLWYKLAPEV